MYFIVHYCTIKNAHAELYCQSRGNLLCTAFMRSAIKTNHQLIPAQQKQVTCNTNKASHYSKCAQ